MSQQLQNSALIIKILHLKTNRKKCFSFFFLFPTVLLFIYFKAGDYFFFCSRALIHFLQVSCCFLGGDFTNAGRHLPENICWRRILNTETAVRGLFWITGGCRSHSTGCLRAYEVSQHTMMWLQQNAQEFVCILRENARIVSITAHAAGIVNSSFPLRCIFWFALIIPLLIF